MHPTRATLRPVEKLLIVLLALTVSLARAAESELTLTTPTGEIHGTLALPDDLAGPVPIVIFVAGSGPTDRNGNNPIGLHTDCYRQLAAGLADAGIASVRYDKRGIAASRAAGPKEADLRFETYADDLAAWAALLRADARFSKLFLLGHSEGAHLVALAAPSVKPVGLISIAGAASRAADTLRAQLRPKLPAALWHEAEQILASLERGEVWTQPVPPALKNLFRPSVQPYLISWFRHDPTRELHDAPCAVLIVQGSADFQIPPENAGKLHAARPDAQLLRLDGMNHVLKTDRGDLAAQLGHSYRDPALSLADGLVDAIVAFVRTPGH